MVWQCYCLVVCSGCTPTVYSSFCLIMQHRLDTLCLCVCSIVYHMQFATHYCKSAQNVCFCVCITLGMYAHCVCVLHTQSPAIMHIVNCERVLYHVCIFYNCCVCVPYVPQVHHIHILCVLYNMHLLYNCYVCVCTLRTKGALHPQSAARFT